MTTFAFSPRESRKNIIWKNDNGTWSHHRDAERQWESRDACATDLRFTEEWLRGKAS